MSKKKTLSKEALRDAMLIIKSVEMYEKRFDEMCEEIDAAIENDDYDKLNKLEKEMGYLDKKVQIEEENMNKFIKKYKKECQ